MDAFFEQHPWVAAWPLWAIIGAGVFVLVRLPFTRRVPNKDILDR